MVAFLSNNTIKRCLLRCRAGAIAVLVTWDWQMRGTLSSRLCKRNQLDFTIVNNVKPQLIDATLTKDGH